MLKRALDVSLSGAIHDLTGSYAAAFVNGIGWNMLNLAIACWLLLDGRRGRRGAFAPAV